MITKTLLSAVFCLLSSVCVPAQDARKIMDAVYKQDNSRDASWRARLDVYDKQGKVRSKKFSLRKLGSLGNSKTLARFTDPPEVRGVGLLTYNQTGVGDRQWLYTPAIQRTRRIAPQERARKFLGTDFTNEDMAERVLDDYTYKIIGEGEVIEGRKTWKIEAHPVSADRSQYSYVYLWVPVDVPYTVLAEMYDKTGQRVRILKASSLEKISGIWIARQVEVSTPADGTRSVMMVEEIRFNSGLKEDLFTQQALEKADAF
jgi:hypothetical protein